MKKILFCAAVAAMAMTACSKTDKAAADDAIADNDVAKVERVAAEASAQAESTVAGNEHKNFTVLNDDSKYRTDTKVERLTILDFNATWCGPCRRFSPIFKAAAQKYKGEVEFVSVDIDRHQHLAQSIGITSVPTLLFIRADGKIYSWVGFLPQEEFFKAIEQLKSNKDVTK